MSMRDIPVLIAAVFAFLITFVLLRPTLERVMLPFYKKGNCAEAGFLRLGDALRAYRGFISPATTKFVVPIFATIYLFFLILFDFYLFPDSPKVDQNYMYFMLGAWGVVMLLTGPTLWIIVLIAIPFGIGYLVFGSIFGGCLASALILAVSFARSYEDIYVFRLISNQDELKTKMYLDGTDANLFKATISRFFRILSPIFVVITIIALILRSNFSGSDFTLSYLPESTHQLIITIPLLIIFMNMSIRIFSGGIYKYLQVDFLAALGKILRLKHENPEKFVSFDEAVKEDDKPPYENSFLEPIDRIPNFSEVLTPKFRTSLSFYSLDALLTLVAVLGIPIIPQLTPENVVTLSSVIKIPLYIVVLLGGANRLLVWLATNKNIVADSSTIKDEIQTEKNFYSSLEQLLHQIRDQQIRKSKEKVYIDISNNQYLLSLAGVSFDEEERVHL